MYVESAADGKMCIYCRGMNNYFSFLFIFLSLFTFQMWY